MGTEVAYNEVFGSNAFWGNGIYFDDKTKHFIAHHNYLHDILFYGFTIKEQNDYYNNTLSNVGAPFLLDMDFQLGVWSNTNLAQVKNNLVDGTLLIRVGVLPSVVKDYGYFEADVRLTNEWKHYVVPIASMHQPGWNAQTPFDLTSVTQLAFTPLTNGDFEFDIDNLALEGQTPLLLDAFESAGAANAVGGSPWAGGSGDGTASTSVTMTYQSGGSSTSSKAYARVTGTWFQGWDDASGISWGNMTEGTQDRDLSAYSGLSFDMRGSLKVPRALAILGNSPIQDHNFSCPFVGGSIPACAIDAGTSIDGITTNAQGAAPDVGAFEAGVEPFAAGAKRAAMRGQCGKVADIALELPDRPTVVWATDSHAGAAGSAGTAGTAGAPDLGGAGVAPMATGGVVSAAGGGSGTSSAASAVTGGGCDCRLTTGSGSRRDASLITAGLVALTLVRRRRRTSWVVRPEPTRYDRGACGRGVDAPRFDGALSVRHANAFRHQERPDAAMRLEAGCSSVQVGVRASP